MRAKVDDRAFFTSKSGAAGKGKARLLVKTLVDPITLGILRTF